MREKVTIKRVRKTGEKGNYKLYSLKTDILTLPLLCLEKFYKGLKGYSIYICPYIKGISF